MKNYKKFLLEQYRDSQGIKTNDKNSKILMLDLFTWILERKEISEKYIKFLSELEIPFETCNCAEVGKSVLDSAVLPYETTIITPHIEGLSEDKNFDLNRLMVASFEVLESQPVIYIPSKKDAVEAFEVPKSIITRFMTQNPYSQENVVSWSKLHNQGEYDITVGVFGSIYDKDIQKKIDNLRRLKQNLIDGYIEEYIEDNGRYYYILSSNKEIKKLERIK